MSKQQNDRASFDKAIERIRSTINQSASEFSDRKLLISDYTDGNFKLVNAKPDDFDGKTEKLSAAFALIDELQAQDIEVVMLANIRNDEIYSNSDDLLNDLKTGYHIHIKLLESKNVLPNDVIRNVSGVTQDDYVVFPQKSDAVAFKLALTKD